MPRIAGASIPKYRKHRAIVSIGGSDLYLGPYGSKASRLEYGRLIGEWVTAGRPPGIVKTADLTIAELCQRYKLHAENYYSYGGTIHNIGTACRTLRLRYGNTLASAFGPLALKAVRQLFIDSGLARTYCNRLTDLLRRMFKWAAGEQLVSISTWQALTAVSGLRRGRTEAPETKPIAPVDDAIVEGTLRHLPDTVQAMVRLQRLALAARGDNARTFYGTS